MTGTTLRGSDCTMKSRNNRLYNKMRRKSGSTIQSPNYLVCYWCKIISTKLKKKNIRLEYSGKVHCSSGTCVICNYSCNETKVFRRTWWIFRVHTVSCSYAIRKFWSYRLISRERPLLYEAWIFFFILSKKSTYGTLYFLNWVI